MKTYRITLYALLSFIVIFVTACSKYGNELSYIEYGKIEVKLTDAPFPYDFVSEANVTVFKVDARLENGTDTNISDEESNFITLYEGEMTVNLLELTNGITKTLNEVEVPIGNYDLVRVYVKDGNVLLTNGTTYDLKVPSGEQTGIKVFIKPSLEVISNSTSTLLLDFDVSKSFVAKGNINTIDGISGFNFKPVLRASNMSVAGTLSGSVITMDSDTTVPLEGIQINVLSGTTIITSAFTDSTGNYTVLGLDAGNYTIIAERANYATVSANEVIITSTNTTNLDFEMVLK